jgi:hypothetical protein
MDERPEVKVVVPQVDFVNMTPEQRAERKKFFATALDRGVIADRLQVPLPDNLHGEWVRRDQFEIDRMRRWGFELDNYYSTSRSMHSDGTKNGQVADVVFMVCSKENKELLDEVKRERFIALHSKPGDNTAAEEKDLVAKVQAHGDIQTFVESKTQQMTGSDVEAAIQALAAQTPKGG